MKRLLLAGGGHAHVEVLRRFADAIPAGWEITLVSPYERQLYSGMVPGVIAGHYALDDCAIALGPLATRAGARFQRASVSLVDPVRREAMLADGNKIAYDLLSLDIGCAMTIASAPRFAHAIPIRPLERAIEAWDRLRDAALAGRVRSISLVGAGGAGVELALAMACRMRRSMGDARPHVRLIGDAPEIVPEYSRGARARLTRALRRFAIGVHAGTGAAAIGKDFVRLEGGLEFASDATFWTAGGEAPTVIRDSGFATDDRGYLLVDDCLRSTSHADVFAAGDCATRRDSPRPKAGVFAVRAGPALFTNLRAAMTGAALEP
ncbi:MAG: FAD-dependent oxidoreductase, partial [Bacillota bacterium]